MSSDLSQLTALGIDPHSALTQVEGVGDSAVVVDSLLPGLSHTGGNLVLAVINDQGLPGGSVRLTLDGTGRSHAVPGLGLSGVVDGVGVLQGVAIVSQILLCPLVVAAEVAGSLTSSPLQLHLGVVLTDDGLVADQSSVVAVLGVAPTHGCPGVRSNLVHCKVTASRVNRQHDSRLHQLSLCNGLQSITLGDGRCVSNLHVLFVVLAQDIVVQSLGQSIIIVSQISIRIDIADAAFNGLGLVSVLAAASSQRQHHDQGQNQAHDLGEFLHLEIPPSLKI